MRRISRDEHDRAHGCAATPPFARQGVAQVCSAERNAAAELGSTLFSRSIDACGLSQAQVGLALGVSRERVKDLCDETRCTTLSLRNLLVLQRRLPSLYSEIITSLAELGGVRAYERERNAVERVCRRAVQELEDVVRDLDA